MSFHLLVGALVSPVFFAGAYAFAEDRECTQYVPEIGRTIHVRCGDAPALPSPPAAVPTKGSPERTLLGLTLVSLTPQLREKYKVEPSTNGVLVTDVVPNSGAADRDIKPGDVIMEANQGVVATPDDMVRSVESVATAGRKSILLLLGKVGGTVRFEALPLN